MVTILIIIASISLLLFFYMGSQYYAKIKETTKLQSAIQLSQTHEDELQNELNNLKTRLSSAIQDPVTGLLGWQLFEDRLHHSMKASQRSQLPLGVIFVDIKRLRMVNDALGFEAGDEALRRVADRLQTSVRQVDSVTRYNRDVFVILLSQLAKPEMAAIVCQRILQAMSQPVEINQQEIYLNVSMGIAIYPQDGNTAEELLRHADEALQIAKENEKQVYQFYREKMDKSNQREFKLMTALRYDAVFDQFKIYYQPIMDESNQTIFCMEALLYWHHPELGVISPSELYHYADIQNKLNDISIWLLRHTCRHFLQWRAIGFAPTCLGVPLLFKQLSSTHFIYEISQVFQELAFNPEYILLELKEEKGHPSFDVLEKAFNMLEYLRIKLALDDFGAGDYSLRYLKNIHAHFLKLSPSFISEIETNTYMQALIKSLVTLAKNMSMQLIIQDITKPEQVKILKELGCLLMQGEFLSPAATPDEVMDKMAVKV